MSKLYSEYLKRKGENQKPYYLFKSGMFYIFLDEDARKISRVVPLKITKLNNDIVKCGFPNNSLDKYMEVFKNLNLDVVLIDNNSSDNKKSLEKSKDRVIKKIMNLDIDKVTPIKALEILSDFKRSLSNE